MDTQRILEKKRFHSPLPPIGQRIIKTGIATFICLIIYMLRGYQGMISQSVIAAIICMQPYTKDSEKTANDRIIGTILGGLWGLGFLWMMREVPVLSTYMILVYLLMAIGIIIVIYSTVLIKMNDAAALAAIVYICVICTFPNVGSPITESIDRVLDTAIGIVVAMLVNVVHLPMRKHPEKLFFVRLQDLAPDRYSHVSSRVLIELNRLYDDGAKICLVSRWAPAFLISQMGTFKINVPVIVMDGAALFDVENNTFYEVVEIEQQKADILTKFILDHGYCACIFAIRRNVMLTFRIGEVSEPEQKDFDMLKRSPYRNYVDGVCHEEDRIAVVRFIVPNEKADEMERLIWANDEIMNYYRISRREQPRIPGYIGFYFYRKDATVRNMAQKLIDFEREAMGEEVKPIEIIPVSRNYLPDRDAPTLLHKIKVQYEQLALPWKK